MNYELTLYIKQSLEYSILSAKKVKITRHELELQNVPVTFSHQTANDCRKKSANQKGNDNFQPCNHC